MTGQALGMIVTSSSVTSQCEWIHNGIENSDYYACGLIRVQRTGGYPAVCTGGDSGGPVDLMNATGKAMAVGVITAKYSNGQCSYTQIQPILSYWQSTITTS